MNDLEKLKSRLIDEGGSTVNMLSRYFTWVPVNTDSESIKKGTCHWPEKALTMIGMNGLNNIEHCVNIAVENKLEGDFLEAGVWRGGGSILIQNLLKNHGLTDRKLFVCDSFEGLPVPQTDRFNVTCEQQDTHYSKNDYLGISLEQVQKNFLDCGSLDPNVIFLKGWFKDTLTDPRITKLALLRADGDMYSSTMDIFNNLYDKVVPGGVIIIDDYGLDVCKEAVHKFFGDRGIDIKSLLQPVNHTIVWFRKP